ncbi:hypothetical protein SteCoe_21846 [Stentor coeruleus]|uniref:Uncharacterized protein n=1 Tax=Stentor coeruleus TaxID=5963 RepID=A0A1R2BNF8_9CILI|nr:hypothetical protein SteCoe_21846 [Stentor coeruleus]
MLTSSSSNSTSPSKAYRVRKRLPSQCNTYKTIRIARKMKSEIGFPKPLSCEEDFVIEKNNLPSEFLKPISGFYNLPELGDNPSNNSCTQMSPDGNLNPRNIVGSVEGFRKSWRSLNERNVKDILKKNRTLLAFASQSVKRSTFLFPASTKDIKVEEKVKNSPIGKVELLHNRHVMYWDKINSNLQRKATIRKQKIKKLRVEWPELKSINIFL